ncbi:hypothetical protein SAMN05421773_11012 [Streptomyces aidingensis]|uniref:Uncharacterized protein n=1 Tax=Streptomyces aidingensis TaxID=910347 RepID=A0A1I1PZR3_9ACTN|nr:hypothetical protein SAMN05421773_11012 [Streptomyces aidingensis]
MNRRFTAVRRAWETFYCQVCGWWYPERHRHG